MGTVGGADHENNKGAAFCCAMGRASGRGAPRAGDSSSQCSKGMGGGNRAATCRAASPATNCTAQTPPRALEGRGSARSRRSFVGGHASVCQELASGMKRTRHKRVPSVRRRALQIIAANPDGYTEAMLAALDISADV